MIYVFKTSVSTKAAVKKIRPALDNLLAVSAWNSDLEDRDRILRIESNGAEVTEQTIMLLRDNGFTCEELRD